MYIVALYCISLKKIEQLQTDVDILWNKIIVMAKTALESTSLRENKRSFCIERVSLRLLVWPNSATAWKSPQNLAPYGRSAGSIIIINSKEQRTQMFSHRPSPG